MLKKLPVLKLLAVAEIALLARNHMLLLDRGERRRLIALIRAGRIRRNLTDAERAELAALVAKTEPRLLFGRSVTKISPVPIPGRLLYGPRRRRPWPASKGA